MAQNLALPQNFTVTQLLNPAADAAGRTSAYLSLKNAHKCWIVCHITQGNAATILLSVLQATKVAGTGSKALANNARIWAALDQATTDALVRQTDGVTFTTDAAVKNKIVVFEVDPAMLDTANNFICIAISTGASNVANITQAIAIMSLRGAQDQPPTPTLD